MSIPRFDPNYTVSDLQKAAEKFRDAGHEYWEAAHRAGIYGAIVWVEMNDGSLTLYTRGEYKQTLLNNVDKIAGGKQINFGAAESESD